jgi:hypothetical protein
MNSIVVFTKIMYSIMLIVLCYFQPSILFAQWSEQNSGTEHNLHSISAVDNNIVWACGSVGTVIYTSDGGDHWRTTNFSNSGLDMVCIWAIDANTALLTGTTYTYTMTYVYKTTNRGINWTQSFYQNGGSINAIVGIGDSMSSKFMMYGDPVGGRWSIWKCTNGGINWDSTGQYVPQINNETGWYNAMCNFSTSLNDYIWFGGINGNIYRSINATNWTLQHADACFSFFFLDSIHGYVGSYNGLFLTTNGGSNWVHIIGTGAPAGITGIGNQIWYCGGQGICYSSNGGFNFSVVYLSIGGVYQYCTKARAANNNNMWFIRTTGGITKYNYVIGIQPISNSVPNEFFLYQNYPNPFNPTTKIKFDIPITPLSNGVGEGLGVRIVIYDILGREVSTLVNEKLLPGSYEVKWDGTNYSSGIYFYKLEAGYYSETKKLVLVR